MLENGRIDVCGGVDTHRDVHMAAVVDTAGRVLGTEPFPSDAVGYEHMYNWLRSQGRVIRVGVEGTGSYGAGLARYLAKLGVEVIEVNRPNRQLRRRLGKTDATDAQAAATAALNGQATARPKTADGPIEAIRMLRLVRRSAVKARTQAINQLQRSGSNSSRPGQASTPGTVHPSSGQDLCCFPSWHNPYHHSVCQKDTPPSGPSIPGTHHRD